MIDIIIPAYNAHNTIKRTLLSISKQKNIDNIKTYIVNDGSKNDYNSEIEPFSEIMDITELKLKKNSGPGVARQYGIDNSDSEFIIFIDSDDILASETSIKILYDNIENSNYDVIKSTFLEQLNDDSLIEHKDDMIWLHGKIFRRDFINKNNIRFNNTYSNEDNGFNKLFFLFGANIKTINEVTYIWLYNENSITRVNNQMYSFYGLKGYINNMLWASKTALKNNYDTERISYLLYQTLTAVYLYYIEFNERQDSNTLLKESVELFNLYNLYPLTDNEKKKIIFVEEYKSHCLELGEEKIKKPQIAFEEFLEKIKNQKTN